ncbi:hypothetical protein ASPWEDRAFT_45253 [Aspergillus wentii DTO 134E9]|uniref:Zn(2)-C6 fungal-type domain-containing protein n=1 Tax=Aspergillus wentii DTO 134E9 TaxID=1073089 RepID=A0A1L9R8Q5_ASPWE|nr:uncharacterized protein ASPWEDRAFT_45253 [Aspergillus wentii DTO 134E9]OJJ31300.1 hypothetical protein ASPWEDRAFT_45253 [Aspergillus wentii DTO 134E9]
MQTHGGTKDQEEGTTPLQCPICPQKFAKLQHLKRHASTHVDEKPYPCEFCGSEYKRSDALRRHWKTCTARVASGNQIPKRSISGKRKQACDRCAERKRACNQGDPCGECALQEVECRYDRTKRQNTGASGRAVYFDETVDSPGETSRLSDKIGFILSSRRKFQFLLKFTHASGINQGYNCNRSFMTSWTPLNENVTASNPWNYLLDEIPSWPEGNESLAAFDSLSSTRPEDDALNLQCSRIWDMFLPLCDETSVAMTTVVSFFSKENILRLLDIFWNRWYPHCPFMHKPTFDVRSCPAILLMTMVLMGGCTSSANADSIMARSLLDIAEGIIFSQPMLSMNATASGDENIVAIPLLQATYMICIIQKWEGNDESKIRIQRDRFTRFVSATRAMGLSGATHGHSTLPPDFDDMQWRAWIQKEEAIRTFNYVFLLDSAFVIFHNSVPRMVLQEMEIDLTCPESWFQASSPGNFISAVHSNPGISDKSISLVDSVRRLCTDDPNQDIYFLDGASKLNFFTIATALHGLIFHQKSALYILPFAANPLNKALDRWEVAWQSNRHSSHEETGFMQHADEFAILARIHLELSYLSPKEWTEFLGRPSEDSRGRAGAFATFDQAGMSQVGDLMLAVEKLNLNS